MFPLNSERWKFCRSYVLGRSNSRGKKRALGQSRESRHGQNSLGDWILLHEIARVEAGEICRFYPGKPKTF